MSLFREEVLERQESAPHGDISLATPLSWEIISYALLASLLGAAGFLAVADYSRTETASGLVTPDLGVLSIVPSRPGIVTEVKVHEGDFVRAGAPLAVVRAEETSLSGAGAQDGVQAALDRQGRGLTEQLASSVEASMADSRQARVRMTGLGDEVARLRSQVDVQVQLVTAAKTDLDQATEIASRGFISHHDIRSREETYLSRRQQLSALQQSLEAKQSELLQATRASEASAARSRASTAALVSAQAQISQQSASSQSSRGYVLSAPMPGRVSALSIHPGQNVSTENPLMAILPAGARLRAELYISTSGIGFVERGQRVKLSVDAFPSSRFGTIDGVVRSVASVPTVHRSADGSSGSVYLADIELATTQVSSRGRHYFLVPGMTLSARIVTEKHSLLRWLLAPLFAIAA